MKFEYRNESYGFFAEFSYTEQKKILKVLNEGVNLLYKLIKNNPNKRTPYFSSELKTSIKNIERWIKQLKEKVEYRGSAKTGGYFARE